MSILIKGIEMPKNCDECHFYRYWDEMASSCRAFNETKWIDDCDMKKERHPDCPLIEVPSHGRLIDADALKIEDGWLVMNRNQCSHIQFVYANAIINTPTIIEAEK